MTSFTSRHRGWRLSTQVLLVLLGILLVAAIVDTFLSYRDTRNDLDQQAGDKSLTIASLVATNPAVIDAFTAPDPPRIIDPIAESIRHSTGAAFIVVANRQGIRYSHPNPALIGTSLLHDPGENPAPVLAGQTYVGVQQGTLGRSMRAKVPIRDNSGRVIGLVSVGILENSVSAELASRLPSALVPPLLALALGVAGAVLLARRVKRQTFGMEPAEIAALLEQREAMLHGVREGTITLDTAGRITLVNDEAQRLLGLDRVTTVGRPLGEVVPAGRVREVLTGQAPGRDEIILLGKRVLVVNHIPVEVRGRPVGAVITLRDRTELEDLLRELDDSRSLAEALRAQEHEFANRLHVIGGLIELGHHDEAVEFINLTSTLHQELAKQVVDGIGDPILSALLLGKAAVASERGIALSVTTSGTLPDELDDPEGLVTVLGNLVDNALDSAQGAERGGRVEVHLDVQPDTLTIRVHDSGAGIDPALVDDIFRYGYTTKVAHDARRRRGIGLAVVSQEVRRRGGRVTVDNIDGAVFTVTLPLDTPARPGSGAP